jgi:tetratricopeptide (TPR) repeat protein
MTARLEAAAELVLLLAIVLGPWPYGSAADPARYGLVAAVLFAVALFAAARALAAEGLPFLALPAAALPALGLVQMAVGASAAPAWTAEAGLVLGAMMAALVFWSERARDRAAAVRLAGAVLVVCAAEAVFGAVQWSLAPDRIFGQTAPIVTTPFGSYVNHNHFAGLLEMGIVLTATMALGLARLRGGATPGVVGLAGIAFGLVAVHVASRSRGGLVALAAGLLVAGGLWARAASRGGGARLRVVPLAIGVLIVLAFGLAVVPGDTRAHLATIFRGRPDASGDYRLDVARDTLRLWAAHPVLGAGLGAYADAFPAFKRGHGDVRTTHAEDDAVELLAETGFAGIAISAWLAALIVRGLFLRLRQGRDPFRKSIAVGAAGAVAALAVHSLFDFNLRLPANALVFASLLGLAASPREPSRRLGGRALPAVVALGLVLLGAAAAWRAAGAVAFERSLRDLDPQMRVAALDPVLDRHPYLPEAYRARALAWRDLAIGRTGFAGPRLDRAERDLSSALRLRPSWGEAWADLGWTRWMRGDFPGARAAMDRALSLDRTHPHIARSHAQLLARLDPAGVAASVAPK